MRQFEGEEIGARIAQARKEAGLRNQQELAELLGVTMRSVQSYEAGDVIPYQHFRRLEEVTGKALSWFLRGETEFVSEDALEALRLELQEIRTLLMEIERRLPPPGHPQEADERA